MTIVLNVQFLHHSQAEPIIISTNADSLSTMSTFIKSTTHIRCSLLYHHMFAILTIPHEIFWRACYAPISLHS